jgi:hypothetical protein
MDVKVLVRFGVMRPWANMENKKKRVHFSLVSSQVRRETKKVVGPAFLLSLYPVSAQTKREKFGLSLQILSLATSLSPISPVPNRP